jgi:hypothetical protein
MPSTTTHTTSHILRRILLLYTHPRPTFRLHPRLPTTKHTTTHTTPIYDYSYICVRIRLFTCLGVCPKVLLHYVSACVCFRILVYVSSCCYICLDASMQAQHTPHYTCCFHATRTSMNFYFYLKKKILTSGVRRLDEKKRADSTCSLPRIQ